MDLIEIKEIIQKRYDLEPGEPTLRQLQGILDDCPLDASAGQIDTVIREHCKVLQKIRFPVAGSLDLKTIIHALRMELNQLW